ncbi:UDP-N-acetyl-D-glucosamine 6-dehydrogenase [Ruminiclostridium hungatei]|uniref:UDP-N-acetyl-D-glucosamine 6-dehydrogenase n=1 Tax=Ruminiclostridium hungatei TaxID=48256 RepID=A0A1V4SIP6_RUMHU|nr:nucleotide sugar dehydrogenase [Ruminiclostridium hungatei]OPX43749.1 UDP-N-acetyl-D-glucosamine 6-dehydrogenase [Ruminiclostridium hungatei]
MKSELLNKIEGRSAVVSVVGLGYVGLPLALEISKAGYRVIGIDVNDRIIAKVNAGNSYIGDVEDTELSAQVKKGQLHATSDFGALRTADCIIICVPTPLDMNKQPDMSFIKSAIDSVAKYLRRDTLVVLESTTYPGTTEELLKPVLERQSGLECEKDFFLAFSPERVDPGNGVFKTKNTPKVVGGMGKDSTELAAALYGNVLEGGIFQVSSPIVAEMEKILENTYRNINIALINEMAIICEQMKINIWEVIDAARTKPYGFQAFYPGPGIGGHCIPLDPFYLTWKAREYDYHTRLIELSGEINEYMPQYVVERIYRILNRFRKPINGSEVLILGIAYKPDVADYRESPALKVIELLEEQGARISYHDPYIPDLEHKNKRYVSKTLTVEVLRQSELVVITTPHKCVDYAFVQKNSPFIFDTKNAMRDLEDRSNIELL